MSKTHDLGPLFTHTMRLPLARTWRVRIVERAHTQETSQPFRKGHSVMLRLPWTLTGVVLGVWGSPVEEETAMYNALGGMFRSQTDVAGRALEEAQHEALYT
jgi:hypothetical protein